jgi:hypothetical protein
MRVVVEAQLRDDGMPHVCRRLHAQVLSMVGDAWASGLQNSRWRLTPRGRLADVLQGGEVRVMNCKLMLF